MATLEKAKIIDVDKNATYDVLFNPKEYSISKSVQWEPHKAPGLDLPEQERSTVNTGASPAQEESKASHDTVKNSVGNIR